MPRFFFHVRDENGLSEDKEGSHHVNLQSALREATTSARELGKQYIDKRTSIDGHYIEICDAKGNLVASVDVREVLESPLHPHFKCPPHSVVTETESRRGNT